MKSTQIEYDYRVYTVLIFSNVYFIMIFMNNHGGTRGSLIIHKTEFPFNLCIHSYRASQQLFFRCYYSENYNKQISKKDADPFTRITVYHANNFCYLWIVYARTEIKAITNAPNIGYPRQHCW